MAQDKEKEFGEARGDAEEQSQSVNVLAKIGAFLALAGWLCLLYVLVFDFLLFDVVYSILYGAPIFWFFALVVCIVVLFRKKNIHLSIWSRILARLGFGISVIPLGIIILFLTASITFEWYKLMKQGSVVEINDVASKATRILASNNDPNDHTSDIDILITGHIDGSATIYLSQNQEHTEYTYSLNHGKVRLRISKAWYSNECILEYEPVDVNSGSLTIRYVFYPCD